MHKKRGVYYEGTRAEDGTPVVTKHVEDDTLVLPPRTDLGRFSGDGLDWGEFNGPSAQLALALCADVLGDEHAVAVCQKFKLSVVVRFPPAGFRITAKSIDEWARQLDETNQVPLMPRKGIVLKKARPPHGEAERPEGAQ